MSKRIALQVSQSSINIQKREAEKTLAKLIEARRIVKSITKQPVATITGEMELDKKISNPMFPNAPKHRLAELLGCENEYRRYQSLRKDIVGIERFEVKDGKVDIKQSWLDELRESHTYYIEGDKATQWQQLKKLEKLWNEIQATTTTPISRYIDVKFDKRMEINTASFRYNR